jgi:hypothetical protein
MAINMLDEVNFYRVPSVQFAIPILAADPGLGYEAGLIYNSSEQKVKYYNGAEWVALGTEGAIGPPTGDAGGHLTGQYPDPQIKPSVIANEHVSGSANIQQTKIQNLSADLAAKALQTTRVIAGTGLLGGGPLSSDVTLTVDPTALSDAYVNVSGDTMRGNLSMGGFKITMLPDTGVFDELDAAPIWFVNQRAAGLKPMLECRAATKGPITLSGLQTIDDVVLAIGDRVLVRDQQNANGVLNLANAKYNGIYLANTGAWTRALDANAEGEIEPGSVLAVTEGLTYTGITFAAQMAESEVPWVPDVSRNFWMIFTSRVVLNAGNGLVLTGNTVDVVNEDGTLVLSPNDIRVASAPKWQTPVNLGLQGHITGTASVDGSNPNVGIPTTITNGVIMDSHVSTSAAIQQSKIANLQSDLAGKALKTTSITAGAGLSGGGNLGTNAVFNVEVHPTLAITSDKIGVVSAPKWGLPITLNVTGAVSGTVDINGDIPVSELVLDIPGSGGSGGTGKLVRHYASNIDGGVTVPVIHNLNTLDVMVQVYRLSDGATVQCGVVRTSSTTVTLSFASAAVNPVVNTLRVIVQGS